MRSDAPVASLRGMHVRDRLVDILLVSQMRISTLQKDK